MIAGMAARVLPSPVFISATLPSSNERAQWIWTSNMFRPMVRRATSAVTAISVRTSFVLRPISFKDSELHSASSDRMALISWILAVVSVEFEAKRRSKPAESNSLRTAPAHCPSLMVSASRGPSQNSLRAYGFALPANVAARDRGLHTAPAPIGNLGRRRDRRQQLSLVAVQSTAQAVAPHRSRHALRQEPPLRVALHGPVPNEPRSDRPVRAGPPGEEFRRAPTRMEVRLARVGVQIADSSDIARMQAGALGASWRLS